MCILCSLVRQSLQIFTGFDDNLSYLFSNRQHLFYIIYQSVVSHALLGILEYRFGIYIDIVDLHILYAVLSLQYLADFHHRLEGRAVHIHIPVFRMGLVILCGHSQSRTQHQANQKKYFVFHLSVLILVSKFFLILVSKSIRWQSYTNNLYADIFFVFFMKKWVEMLQNTAQIP